MEPREPETPAARSMAADMPFLPSLLRTGGGWPPDDWWGWGGRCSVVLGESALNVGAGQEDEDVRLNGLDEELEEDHDHGHDERDARRGDHVAVQQVPAGDGEHREQQVAGEHVGEESDR